MTGNRIANFLSILFHPLWVPVYLFVALMRFDRYALFLVGKDFQKLFLPLLLINAIAPAFSIWLLAKGGYISSVRVENRRERFVPILLVLFYYGGTYALIRITGQSVPWLIPSLMLALIASLVAALSLNFILKISLHMLALGGAFGVVLAIQAQHRFGPIAIAAAIGLLAGLVGWARLKLNAHSPREVYAGFLVGAVFSYFILRYELVI
jgi:membrane-associated phospholipid phosphatase